MIATLRQRNFALLWFGGLISMIGDWALFIALPIFVYELTGSALATGLMFAAGRLPGLLLGSVAGVFVDRWDRKHTLVITNVLFALGLLPLLAVRSADLLWVVYLISFIQSVIRQFFGPAENALLPRLVGEEHLTAANALNGLNNNLARLIGPVVGGALAAMVGLHGVVLVDAVTFALAAGLIALITADCRPARDGEGASPERDLSPRAIWGEWLAGLALVRRSRSLTAIFTWGGITSLGEGVFGVLIVAFTSAVLGGGARELGWLMAGQAVGGLIGGVLIGQFGGRLTATRLLVLGSIGIGAIDLAIFNYPAFVPGIALGIALFILVGLPAMAAMTGANTLLQSSAADSFRGRVFGAFSALRAALTLAGTLLAGGLADALGIVTVLNVQGFGYIVAGLLVVAILGSGAQQVSGARARRAAAGEMR